MIKVVPEIRRKNAFSSAFSLLLSIQRKHGLKKEQAARE
jgi:hypothetical protein